MCYFLTLRILLLLFPKVRPRHSIAPVCPSLCPYNSLGFVFPAFLHRTRLPGILMSLVIDVNSTQGNNCWKCNSKAKCGRGVRGGIIHVVRGTQGVEQNPPL